MLLANPGLGDPGIRGPLLWRLLTTEDATDDMASLDVRFLGFINRSMPDITLFEGCCCMLWVYNAGVPL